MLMGMPHRATASERDMNDSIRWVLARAAALAAVTALAVPAAATAAGPTSSADYKLLEDGQVVGAPR
jgi:hypothetical protein